MPHQNGRHAGTADDSRPSWQPQDQGYRAHDDDERGRHWDEQRERSVDRGGQGQSGYAAGRRDDRGMGTMGRNQSLGRTDERDLERGVHTDDRFYGRGGDVPRGYGDDERDQPRFVQHTGYRGGSAFGRMDQSQDGNYGNTLSQHGGYEGNYGQPGQQDAYGQGNFGVRARGGHRGKGPQNFTRSDERLKEHVSELLTEHDEIDASNLEVTVTSGEVTLTGTVDDRHQRRMIEDLVEGIAGVRDVHMSIKLRGASPAPRPEPHDPRKARA